MLSHKSYTSKKNILSALWFKNQHFCLSHDPSYFFWIYKLFIRVSHFLWLEPRPFLCKRMLCGELELPLRCLKNWNGLTSSFLERGYPNKSQNWHYSQGSLWHGSNLYITYKKSMPSNCSAHAKQNFKERKLLSWKHPDVFQNWRCEGWAHLQNSYALMPTGL